VAIGIPADLLRRRPDVRRAERLAAAQAPESVCRSRLLSAISINGRGLLAQRFPICSKPRRSTQCRSVVQLELLNYGRILNNSAQDALFRSGGRLPAVVLTANQTWRTAGNVLLAQQRAKLQAPASMTPKGGHHRAGQIERYIDFTASPVEQALVLEQDLLAQARGEIAAG